MEKPIELIVDTTEAQKKLDAVLDKLKQIDAIICKSWLLRFLFYGFNGSLIGKKDGK